MNSAQTMKQQRSASGLRPTRICQLLVVVIVIKLGLIGCLLYDGVMAGGAGPLGFAYAADGAGAPPAPQNIESPLSPEGSTTVPAQAATPRSSAGNNATNDSQVLTPIGQRRGIGRSANSTGGDSLTREVFVRRQDELARKEEELKSLEKDISSKLEQMQVLESRLQIMMKDAQGTTDAKLRHLVDVLTNMKAKQAASVLETLDQRVGVKILANMRGRQAGEILTYMDPKKAASLAEALSRMQMPLE